MARAQSRLPIARTAAIRSCCPPFPVGASSSRTGVDRSLQKLWALALILGLAAPGVGLVACAKPAEPPKGVARAPAPPPMVPPPRAALPPDEDGYELWLRYRKLEGPALDAARRRLGTVVLTGTSPTLTAVRAEVKRALAGFLGQMPSFAGEV